LLLFLLLTNNNYVGDTKSNVTLEIITYNCSSSQFL